MGITRIKEKVWHNSADAYEADNGTGFTIGDNIILCDSNTDASERFNGGFHFDEVAIPVGSKIELAWLKLIAPATSTSEPNLTIYCEDVNDATHFGTTADVTSRVTTSASVDWVSSAHHISGGGLFWSFSTPDISACIQEVVDRGGWASHDIVVLLKGKSDKVQTCEFYAHEQSSGVLAAELYVIYSEPGTDAVSRGFHIGQ